MEFITEYGLFLAKVATLVVAFLVVLGALISAGSRGKRGANAGRGQISIVRVNDELDDMRDAIRKSVLDETQFKHLHKMEKKRHKQEEKERKKQLKAVLKLTDENIEVEFKKRVYIIDFNGDVEASEVENLREEVTTILSLATSRDEVLLRLESPGGMVHAYGLASSQLLRIRDKGIPLTICVDKVAASGGYMMACLASTLIAAPFAILGSIGVLVQLPNFHRLLHKHDVDYETISAGEFKTTLTTFGEITSKGREKVKEDVEEMHALFKNWVKEHRPAVEIDAIATGETWVGIQALERNMVDAIMTSDECIVAACDEADVFQVSYEIRRSIGDKLGAVIQSTADKTVMSWWKRVRENSFYS